MSAHARDDEVNRALELGASGFLAKPFTPEQLHEKLGEIERAQALAKVAGE